MTAPAHQPDARRERPQYVYCQRPRCPACGSVRLLAKRSRKEADGSVTRWVKCDGCQCRAVLVLE